MDLPGELRNQIYRLVLTRKGYQRFSKPLGLLLANKKIREECLPTYYGSNKFQLPDHFFQPFYAETPSYAPYLRRVCGWVIIEASYVELLSVSLDTSSLPNKIFIKFYPPADERHWLWEHLGEWARTALPGPVLDGSHMLSALFHLKGLARVGLHTHGQVKSVRLSCQGCLVFEG